MAQPTDNQAPQDNVNFGAILQSIMLDYEQLANAHNTLMRVLFKKGLITSEEWTAEMEVISKEKAAAQEKMTQQMQSGQSQQSNIIRP